MADTRLSLRAAILLAFIAVGEVSAARQQQHRRRGRCSPSHTTSSSDLPTPISSSTFETIVVPTWTSKSLSEPESNTSTVLSETGSVSTAEETTTTSTPSIEETSTSVEETVTSAEPTSSSESLPTSTSSISTTSEAAITSSAPICEPTVSTWAPELCWRSVPTRCSSMTSTTLLAAALTSHVSACSTMLRAYGTQAPEVTGCFENFGQPGFDLTSAYSCVSSASIYCQTTSACAPAATATSTPLIPPYDDPSFEAGTLGSWNQVGPATPGNLVGSISTEQANSGQHSLKLEYNNLFDDGIAWEHKVRFEPGARYEFSFWYYSLSNQSRGTLTLKIEYPGLNLMLPVQMSSQQTQRWIRQKFTTVPATSFGTLHITYAATKGTVGNTIYIDDVTVTKVS